LLEAATTILLAKLRNQAADHLISRLIMRDSADNKSVSDLRSSTKEPFDSVPVCETSVDTEWHLLQFDQELLVCTLSKLTEDGRKLVEAISQDVHCGCIALLSLMDRVKPVCSGEFDSFTLKESVGDFVMLFREELRLHGCVRKPCQGQRAAEACTVELHCFSAVAVEQ